MESGEAENEVNELNTHNQLQNIILMKSKQPTENISRPHYIVQYHVARPNEAYGKSDGAAPLAAR